MCIPLEEAHWLYRGVPIESAEAADVHAMGEVVPPRPDRTGEMWRQFHILGDTNTAYTSWTTSRAIAVDAAEFCVSEEELSGGTVILRVPVSSIPPDRIYYGHEDEEEYLIEGTVENVSISESELDEEPE